MEEYIEDEEINKQNELTDVNENDATMLKNVETGNPFISDVGGDSQAGLSTSANEKGENSVETLKKDPPQNQPDIPRNTPPPDYKGDAKDLPVDGQTVINESDGIDKVILASANGDNFWLVGNYKRVVKKIEDGAKLCEEISQMMSERAEIESLYAKKLKAWNKKWNQSFSKGLEYGSVLQSLIDGLAESNDMADIHLAIQGKVSEVSSQMAAWKSQTYHKGIIGIKEAKKAEEGFNKSQKPWAKKFDDTMKGKQNYHTSCQTLDQAKAQEEDLKAAVETTTQEQLAKVQNKVKKATQEREAALVFYKESLRDIQGYNQKYKDDMVYEYDKWETAEGKRKDFVIEKMKQFQGCVDMSQFSSRIDAIYSKMAGVYKTALARSDLESFRRNLGPEMPYIELSFIEYSLEEYNSAKLVSKDQNQTNDDTSTSPKPKDKSKVCVTL